MTDLTIAEFRALFGNIFADTNVYPDVAVQMQLDEAAIEVSPCIFKKYYKRAAYFLTAHLLTLFHEWQMASSVDSSGTSAANPKGVISSVSVGDLSLSMELPEYSTSSDDKFLASTVYGQEFIRIRNKMSRGTLLARTPMVKNCPTMTIGRYIKG